LKDERLGFAERDAVGEAHVVGARGKEPFVHPVMAEVALLGDAPAHVIADGFVRARVDALLASHTPFVIHHNDSIGSF
jgi:hypothetical protein